MATEVVLPQWGMNMEEGTVVRWLKQEGESVASGEPLADIETAKINDQLESPADGVLRYIVVPEGETIPVRTLLAIIAAAEEDIARPAPTSSGGAPKPASLPGRTPGLTGAAPRQRSAGPIQVIPAARRLAAELQVDLAYVEGSGPGGRVLEEDVRRAAARAVRPAATADLAPLQGMRKTIAERMLRSAETMAQVTLTTEAEVSAMVALRKELVGVWREQRMRPVDQDLVLMAVARALRNHPYMNATLDERGLQQHEHVHLGVALALPTGLVVVVVPDADNKDITTVAREVRALTQKAREGALRYKDVSGSTFTVTSLAQYDIDAFSPLINPPEVGILGVGRIVGKAVGVNGEVVLRPMMHLSLTFDHRAVDGAPAAQFLQSVVRQLAEPGWMLR